MKPAENDAVFFFPGPYSLIAAYSQGFCYARIVRAYTTFPSGVVTASIQGRDAAGVDFELPRVEVLNTLPTVDRTTCFAIPIPEEGCEIGDGLVPPAVLGAMNAEGILSVDPAPFIGFYPTASRFVGQGGKAGGAGATAAWGPVVMHTEISAKDFDPTNADAINARWVQRLEEAEPTDAEKQAATCLDRFDRQAMTCEDTRIADVAID